MLLLWSLILSGLIVQMMLRKPIEKGRSSDELESCFFPSSICMCQYTYVWFVSESVIIMPALGVQLETHYVR